MQSGANTSDACFCCGWRNNIKAECRFKNEAFLSCGKIGHLAKVCKTSKNNRDAGSMCGRRNASSIAGSNDLHEDVLLTDLVSAGSPGTFTSISIGWGPRHCFGTGL